MRALADLPSPSIDRSLDGATFAADAPDRARLCGDPLCSCARAGHGRAEPDSAPAEALRRSSGDRLGEDAASEPQPEAAAGAEGTGASVCAAKRRRLADYAAGGAPPVSSRETSSRGSLRVVMHRGAYHSLERGGGAEAGSEPQSSWKERALWAPHLVFAPNAGLAAYRSWMPTLRALAAHAPLRVEDRGGEGGPLLVLTDYTEEVRTRWGGQKRPLWRACHRSRGEVAISSNRRLLITAGRPPSRCHCGGCRV